MPPRPFGFKHSEETKAKMRIARARQVITPEARLHMRLAKLGKKRPNYKRTKHVSQEVRELHRLHMTGPRNHQWKGGVTPHHRKLRGTSDYDGWRQAVFARDHYRCFDCGAKSGKGSPVYLEAHHIYPF